MTHEHLGFQSLDGLQSHADNNDDRGAADGQRANLEDVTSDNGSQCDTARYSAPNMVILLTTLMIKSAVGLPGRKPGMKPPFFFRLFATSTGLKLMEE